MKHKWIVLILIAVLAVVGISLYSTSVAKADIIPGQLDECDTFLHPTSGFPVGTICVDVFMFWDDETHQSYCPSDSQFAYFSTETSGYYWGSKGIYCNPANIWNVGGIVKAYGYLYINETRSPDAFVLYAQVICERYPADGEFSCVAVQDPLPPGTGFTPTPTCDDSGCNTPTPGTPVPTPTGCDSGCTPTPTSTPVPPTATPSCGGHGCDTPTPGGPTPTDGHGGGGH